MDVELEEVNTQYMLPGAKVLDNSWTDAPAKIGPYKIKKLLNKGGMSVLYLGLHNLQEIVVKVLSPKFLSHPEIYSRFLKEAEIIALANHPNVVRLLGQGTWEKGLYIAMEFVRGISLRQFIQQGEISHDQKNKILLEVSYALCHLHTHGIVHRDLKPDNILIDQNGSVKVIDFGIAQLEWERGSGEQGGLIGTPAYMSPEQKRNPSQATYASDIYSLGILAYELFAGDPKHGKIELERVPKGLRPVLEKAIKTKIEDRYPDIVDWITAFKAYSNDWKKLEAPVPKQIAVSWTPKTALKSSIVDIELSSSFEAGAYLEVFELSKKTLAAVYARPLDPKDTTSTPLLVGMVKMAIECERPSLQPIPFMDRIRKVVGAEPKMAPFAFALLLIESSQFSFLSCGDLKLWKWTNGEKELFATPNPPLGARQTGPGLLGTGGGFESGSSLQLQDVAKTPVLKVHRL